MTNSEKGNMSKPRVVKRGFWIVLRFGHPVYGWSYNRCFDNWRDAIKDALANPKYTGEGA